MAVAPTSRATLLFRLVASGFAVAGLYHLAALCIPAFAKIAYSPAYPPLRHVTFVVVDTAGVLLFLARPRWLIWPYLILAIQVMHGHGVRLWQTWARERQINGIDALAAFAVLLGLLLLVFDRVQHNRSAAAKPQHPH